MIVTHRILSKKNIFANTRSDFSRVLNQEDSGIIAHNIKISVDPSQSSFEEILSRASKHISSKYGGTPILMSSKKETGDKMKCVWLLYV
jgi:hypothetical protein